MWEYVEHSMPNITMAIDEKLLKSVRVFAKRRGTTVNALVREELTQLIQRDERQEEARLGLLKLIEESSAQMGPNFKFDREEMYESPMLSGHKHFDLRRRRKKG
jgi:hypothetical protein